MFLLQVKVLQDGLIFLMNLAWESRVRLPLLMTVAFMALNIRMQLEINIYRNPQENTNHLFDVLQENRNNLYDEDDESDSWETTDELDMHSNDELTA